MGNPGTGKTTVARLIAKLYRQLGVLEKGQLIEVDRGGLVAGYVGQTALKTQEKIDEAMGGVLFIDEAYTLAKGGSDFGQEAIDTILKAMEDKRDSFVVIVAGYSEPMERFLESNPGLKSRFNKNIIFEDYSRAELISILKSFCAQNDMALTTEAEQDIDYYLEVVDFQQAGQLLQTGEKCGICLKPCTQTKQIVWQTN
ncbi:MAG: AAA family ATPase [Oscillospiraceae bacterium]